MDIWKQLGIDATADLAAIRAAYAAKAKKVHPEEHPEEFRQLREAYQAASRYAKAKNRAVPQKKQRIAPEATREQETGDMPHAPGAAPNQEPTDTAPAQETAPIQEPTDLPPAPKTAPIQEPTDLPPAPEAALKQEPTDLPPAPEAALKQEPTDLPPAPKATLEKETGGTAPNTETTSRTEGEYHYDEIQQADSSEAFFLDLFCLAQNPYLMNDLRCWKWFFSQPEYQPLYRDTAFLENLVHTLCTIKGFAPKTIRCIDDFIRALPLGGTEPFKCKSRYYRNSWNRLKRPRILYRLVSVERAVSPQQKQIHDVILAQAKREAFSDSWKDQKLFTCYLKLYLEFARENTDRVERLYQQNRYRAHYLAIFVIGMIATIFLMYGTAKYTLNTKKPATNQEKWEQERQENIKKWQEQQQQKEHYDSQSDLGR